MFSRALVISAETNFETLNPVQKKSIRKLPFFSAEYKEAHKKHKDVSAEWRKAGRPNYVSQGCCSGIKKDSSKNIKK